MYRYMTPLDVLAVGQLCIPASSAQHPGEARVVLISIDGLMPSSYTNPALEAQTPNLRRLARPATPLRWRRRPLLVWP